MFKLIYLIESLPQYGVLQDSGVDIVATDLPKTLTQNELTYIPDTDYKGSDSFTYKVNDGILDSQVSKVTIRVAQGYLDDQTKKGNDIDGDKGDKQGQSIAFNEDATIMAVGASEHDNKKGTVRVYEMDLVLNEWTQIGEDIDGKEDNDNQGFSVSLSADGYTLAVGATGHSFNTGAVRVYKYSSSSWTQIGRDLEGSSLDDSQGSSVSLSKDGDILAVGAYGHDNNQGRVRIYQKRDNTWGQMAVKLNGELTNEIRNSADKRNVTVEQIVEERLMQGGALVVGNHKSLPPVGILACQFFLEPSW